MSDRSSLVTSLIIAVSVVASTTYLGVSGVIQGEAVTGILGAALAIPGTLLGTRAATKGITNGTPTS